VKTNVPTTHRASTHEGGPADPHQRPALELERTVATCLLGEDTFYEKGVDIKARIATLCTQVPPATVASLAVRARDDWKLRHVPLWLTRQLARVPGAPTASTLEKVVQRPDEMAEFLSLYWADNGGKRSLPAAVKRGLAAAFQKFSPYQLAKWNRDGAVKLRDVLFLCHAKPRDEAQAAVWKQLIDGKLAAPDTWEVALSSGADKRATWERLLREDKLGQMALVMNLRNMVQAGVPLDLVGEKLRESSKQGKALPFRFVSAVKHAPALAQAISDAMVASIDRTQPLVGSTMVVVDVSGSMDAAMSSKGEVTRWEAASALAVLIVELCPQARVFTFSNQTVEVPSYHGLGLVAAITNSQSHQGTYLGRTLTALQAHVPNVDRIVVVTDEQAHDTIPRCWAHYGYVINVAPYKPALPTSQGGWKRLNGFSERIVDWMRAEEALDGNANT
jgi:60 kDa SS-A/Ro ribonucleoprotein